MAKENRCLRCGAQMPADAPEGLCPKCLMKGVMSKEDADVTLESPRIEGPGTTIGRYKLLELIGEGGMGLVYLAEQQEPIRRRVALKIVKLGMDTRQVIARFEAEKQMLALLDHPNIARVYDAGTTQGGRPYFVMEYVKGQSITEYCDQHKTSIEDRLRLFRQVCEAVQYAHQKGIIHRDIKPSNILVSVEGDRAVPKIIDFGIAKAVTQQFAEGTLFTQQGQLLGTPEYMSPEQVDLATQDIDTRSDIYSLGVVLYQLLAGVLPFGRESFERGGFAEIQRVIQEVDPPNPSTALSKLGEEAKKIAERRKTQVVPLARRLHRELEWIPLKAMRKERVRRYRSASELADDIQNYLNGNPLIAGPETAMYRVKKFVRRHAGSVATVALVAAAIILGLVISTAMYFRSERALQREAIARNQAEQAEKVAQEQRNIAETKSEDLRRAMYVNSIQLADAKHREGNAGQVRSLLDSCPEDLRGWEWNRLNYIHDESLKTLRVGSLYKAVLSPDGTRIVTCGDDDKTVRVWDLTTGEELKTFRGHEKTIYALAISPDGRQIASAGDEKIIKLWDVQSGTEVMTLRGHGATVWTLVFSPDGKQILSGSNDKTVKLWDVQTGTELMTLFGHDDTAAYGYFSPDGKRIVSPGDRDGKIKVWDAASGVELLTILWSNEDPISYPKLMCAAFRPDSRRIVLGSNDGVIKVWDMDTGATVITIPVQNGSISSVAYSPNGELIAAGRYDKGLITIWDAETGKEIRELRGHDWAVECVGFSQDGLHLVSASRDGTVKLWDPVIDRDSVKIRGHARFVQSIAFSPDGRQIVSHSADSTVKLWDAETGEVIRTMRGPEHGPRGVAFSPDGRHIAAGEGGPKAIRVWDVLTGAELMALRGHKDSVRCTVFSPDGKYIVSGSDDRTIKLWDALNGAEVMTLQGHEDVIVSVAFSPDSKRLASGSWDKTLRVWDLTSRVELMTLKGHLSGVMSVAFSPDGKRIASASLDRTAKIWDAATGVELMTLYGHRASVYSVEFSPDGRRIITSGRDAVRLWDYATGAELVILGAGSGSLDVAFSPDGQTIAAASGGSLVLWQSTAPAGGYEPLRNAETARKLMERLRTKCESYHEVISLLQKDETLDSSVCRLAIQMADSRRWEDADKLSREAFKIVSSSSRNIDEYRTALEKVEKANAWEPNDPAIISTLGAAQYRLSLYDEALTTLTNASRILSDAGEECDPTTVAFMAMSLHRLSRTDEAKIALEQLQELFKDDQFVYDILAQDSLAEAEKLIEGEK